MNIKENILKRNSRLKTGILLLGLILVQIGCKDIVSVFNDGRNFTKEKDIQDLEELIKKNVTPEMEILEIFFRKADSDVSTYSFSRGLAEILFVNSENTKKRRLITIDLKENKAFEDTTAFYYTSVNHRPYKGIKNVTKLGCEKIAANVNSAIAMLAADSLSADGIGTYSIIFHNNPEKIEHRFTIERHTGSDSSHNYYDEYTFKADLDGNLDPQ